MVHLVQVRQQSPWLYPDSWFNLTSWKAVQDRCLKVLHGFTKQVVGVHEMWWKIFETFKQHASITLTSLYT